MSDSLVGALDPRLIEQRLDFLEALGRLPWPELLDVLRRIRQAELAETSTSPGWAELVDQTERAMVSAIRDPDFPARQAAEAHARTMLGDHLALTYSLAAYWTRPDALRPYIRTSGEETVRAALAAGKGAVLAQYHWGPFQLLFPLLLILGYRVLQLFGEEDARTWALRLLQRNPALAGRAEAVLVPGEHLKDQLAAALAQGYLVCIPPEVTAGRRRPQHHTTFLGYRVCAPEGPALLAAICNVPLLPVWLEVSGCCLQCIFGRPIWVPDTRSESLQEALDALFRELEARVLATPEKWRGWGFLDEMRVPDSEESVKA